MKNNFIFRAIRFLLLLLLFNRPATAQGTEKVEQGYYLFSIPEGATVHIAGEVIGKTPCYFPYKISGKYNLWVEKKGYEKWSRVVDFNRVNKDSLKFSLFPKTQLKAFSRSLLIPGWGQRYSEQNLKGKIYFTLQLTSLLSLGLTHIHYDNCLKNYDEQLSKYQIASKSSALESQAWREVTSAHTLLEDAHKYRMISVYTAIGVYALNLLDITFFYPNDLREMNIFGLSLSNFGVHNESGKVVLSYSF